MPKFIDLTGKIFGRLTVERNIGRHKTRLQIIWECKCECGNRTIVAGNELREGETKSCGCLIRDVLIKQNTKHNLCHSRGYKSWSQMIQRCENPKATFYIHYGGRGIKVCEHWHKFENFYEDMGNCPDNLELNRINNNNGYFKENCKWSSKQEQMRNTRSNINITFKGKTQCISAWAQELNINIHTLFNRINTYKWSIEKAFTTPVRKMDTRIEISNKIFIINNQAKTLKEWATHYNINIYTVIQRINYLNWDVQEALETPIDKRYARNKQH